MFERNRNTRKVFFVKAFDYKNQCHRTFVVETPDYSHTREHVARYGWNKGYALGSPQVLPIPGSEEILGPHDERESYKIWELDLSNEESNTTEKQLAVSTHLLTE